MAKQRPKKNNHPFSCTDDLWTAIRARAKQLNLSASQYLATLAFNEIDSPTLSLTIKPAPGSKKPKVSREML